ncbi:MAG: hypothetical protein JST08_11900 [Actinobacteria bacterium]|nr:hypothetical protein [Actinomycetota bacterium]
MSSRRSLVWLVGMVVCVALALALSAAGAVGKPSCKKGAEAAGCRLPDGARFYKELGDSQALTVQVGGKGLSVTAFAVPIKCTKYIPLLGDESYVEVGLSGSQHPKVGKSYTLKESETRRGEEGEGTSSTTTEVTLDFKSAKQVLVSIHQVTTTDGEPGCDGRGSWTVKRQS